MASNQNSVTATDFLCEGCDKPDATNYCIDCEKLMCDECAGTHRNQNVSVAHKVVSLRENEGWHVDRVLGVERTSKRSAAGQQVRASVSGPNNDRSTSDELSSSTADSTRDGVPSMPPSTRLPRQESNQQTLRLAFGVATLLVALTVGRRIWSSGASSDSVRTPLAASPVIEAVATSTVGDPELYWGSYRSGLYFGMKTRHPRSPVFGLMWVNQFTTDSTAPTIRHECRQSDGLAHYGWLEHDGVTFGVHEVVDEFYNVSVEFVKRTGGAHGGDWTAVVRVTKKPVARKYSMSLFFYVALDSDDGQISADIARKGFSQGVDSIHGYTPSLGSFRLSFSPISVPTRSNYLVGYAAGLDLLQDTFNDALRWIPFREKNKEEMSNVSYAGLAGVVMPDGIPASRANLITNQVTTVKGDLEMEVVFESGSVVERPNRLSGDVFRAQLSARRAAFARRFEAVFGLASKGYDEARVEFARAALSNMLGGIGYFYGNSLVSSEQTGGDAVDYWPAPLYTAVPSRSFFPRGFLWDEGFHNLLIGRWDRRISMDIIGHWLDLMNADGWIPREQILGDEARARVPDEFIVQNQDNANPPTLFLPLARIMKDVVADPKDDAGLGYLKRLFPRLRAWYGWYERTQAGQVNSAYRWRGRNATNEFEVNALTLTSGLDDYPRASHPTAYERHVDLRCWMAFASGVMADMARALNDDSWREYEAKRVLLTNNQLLNELHWSERSQRYADFGLHTDNVGLERPRNILVPGKQPLPPRQMERVVRSKPKEQFVDSGFGYVNIFPLLLKIVDANSPKLARIIGDIREKLWTPYGLRSLERGAPLYGQHNTEHDPPHWRGAIWININYLAVGALRHYATTEGPYSAMAEEAYRELARNVVENVYEQYRATGYVWQEYDDATGRGKGSHPFTGWSALVVSIMAEQF